MKKQVLAALAIIFTTLPSQAAKWSELYKTHRKSIPMIFSMGGVCSGAFISQKHILTAAHCASKMRPIYVVLDENKDDKIPAQITKLDFANDLALIKINKEVPISPLEVAGPLEPFNTGDEIATIGHPTHAKMNHNIAIDFENTYLLSKGIVSKITDYDIISDMSISPGNSGGPVFNEKGKIVGVVSRKRVDKHVGNIGYIPHQVSIHKLLRRSSRRHTFRDAKSSFSMGILFNNHSYFKKQNGVDSSLSSIDIKLNIWDRWVWEFEGGLTNPDLSYYMYSTGYKMLVHFDNQSIVNMYFTVGNLDYDHPAKGEVQKIDQQNLAYSFQADWSLLPISFKYTFTNIENKAENIISLGFNLMN